ncbi:MAG: class B sortase [Christensenellales bacterium]
MLWKRRPHSKQKLRYVLLGIFSAFFILSSIILITDYAQDAKEKDNFKRLAAIAGEKAVYPGADTEAVSFTVQAEGANAMLPQYKKLYEQNADMAGWVKIDGTSIDYPVMYSGDDFYASHDFDKEKSKSGVPFIDGRCAVQPFGANTIIYGHHMKNGSMFTALVNYENEYYFKEHPIILFDTLYKSQKFEIIAVFKSRIYQKEDAVFKYYNFLDADNEREFDEYIANVKALSLYDTGGAACYGDMLLTLVTCSYHAENGQFVIVASAKRD